MALILSGIMRVSITNAGKQTLVATEYPSTVPFSPDMDLIQAAARTQRAELHRQRHRIRSIDMQIRAAQSLLLPQLDGIARYNVNGFGDHLISDRIPSPDESLQSAYHNLFDNNHSGWQLGFQFTHNLGRRLERTRLRNLQLQARKARTVYSEQMVVIESEVAV